MKECLKTVLTVCGSIIGAGFISGRELVRFFGGEANLPLLFFTFFLFFALLFCLFSVGRKYGGFQAFLSAAFPRFKGVVQGVFLLSSFVTIAAMLAGVNALEKSFSPYAALFSAAGCFLVVGWKKGMGGIALVNAVLTPAILLYVLFGLLSKGEFKFTLLPQNAGMGSLFSLLYVGMNLFSAVPVALDGGAKMESDKRAAEAAFLSAALVTLCIALILSAVAATAGAAEKTMPLLFVFRKAKLFPLISYFGIVTTLVAAYYPLYAATEKCKRKNAARILLLAAASVFSLWGLEEIVEKVYPALGVAGVLFSAVAVFHNHPFQKGNEKIHYSRQQAQNYGRRHHEV